MIAFVPWPTRHASVVALFLGAAVLTGCGSSSGAASAPTATTAPATSPPATSAPTAVVVTATPAKTTKVVVVVTATPKPSATPKPGHSIPLPGATPVPTAPGLTLGMITRPMAQVQAEQAGANRGDKHYTFYLHPAQVIKQRLPNYGFKPPIDLVSPPKPVKSYSGRPVRKGVVKYQNTLFQVYVAQPGVRGPKGIWDVVTILRQHLITGQISRPMSVVNRIQTNADAKKKNFTFYTDPNKVVLKELPQYGFDPAHYKIVQNARPVTSPSGRPLDLVVVNYYDTLYDVYVAQPGKRGKTGIWVTVTIQPV